MVLSVESGKPPRISVVEQSEIKPGCVEWLLVNLHGKEGFQLHHETHGKVEPDDLVGYWDGSVAMVDCEDTDFRWEILTASGEKLDYPGIPEDMMGIIEAEEKV